MMTEPTVLVVGAGASMPYGYPSGKALADELVRKLSQPASTDVGQRLRELGYDDDPLRVFANELRRSSRYSVDAFLEKRPEFLELGKRAIAAALIPLERDEPEHPAGGDWYRYLFNRLMINLDAGKKEKLSILTFNYDRSLEHRLFVAFRSALAPAAAVELMSSIEILHLHGRLCHLPWQKGAAGVSRRYGNDNNNDFIIRAADGIRIIHEAADQDEGFLAAQRILGEAKRVFFLGFGYHPTNVRRILGGNWAHKLWHDRNESVRGSGLNLTGAEADEARALFAGRIKIIDSSSDALMALRHHVDMIS